jgi:hypothetical protein
LSRFVPFVPVSFIDKAKLFLGKPRTYQTVGCWEFEKRDTSELREKEKNRLAFGPVKLMARIVTPSRSMSKQD